VQAGLNQSKRKRKRLRGNNMKDWMNNKKVWIIAAVIIVAMLWNYFHPVV
tara:strand:- start:284 stop:433 length:150 start_codon:yes stop_codon:yes gene_type:complete